MTGSAVTLLVHEQLAVGALPIALLVGHGDHCARRCVLALASPLMARDAKDRLVAHRTVRGIRSRTCLVIATDELVGVILRHQLEARGVTFVAGVCRHEPLVLVLKPVAPVAGLHVWALWPIG